MKIFTINWTEQHSLQIEANTIEEAIEEAQDSDQDSYGHANFDVNDSFECEKDGTPIK